MNREQEKFLTLTLTQSMHIFIIYQAISDNFLQISSLLLLQNLKI